MGVYLSKPIREKHTVTGSTDKFDFVASSMQGWRTSMEDAHISCTDSEKLGKGISLFAVFDGHGGKEVAKYCRDHFIDQLIENKNFRNKQYELALIETFMKMDELLDTKDGRKELFRLADKGDDELDDYPESQAGCTANVALFVDDDIYVANAGDSRSVMFDSDWKYKELSKDHKPDDPKEKERITKAKGNVVEGRVNGNLNLSRAIGDLEFKRTADMKPHEQLIIAYPDVIKYTIKSDDRFLLMGCDGIWEKLTIREMSQHINERINSISLPEIIESLLDNLLADDTQGAKGCDNMSAIIILFKKD